MDAGHKSGNFDLQSSCFLCEELAIQLNLSIKKTIKKQNNYSFNQVKSINTTIYLSPTLNSDLEESIVVKLVLYDRAYLAQLGAGVPIDLRPKLHAVVHLVVDRADKLAQSTPES